LGVALTFEGTSPVFVSGDRARLRLIYHNLLDNAVKYNKSGGTVRIILSCEGGQAKVAIADSGVGIPEEDLPHIFDRFYRVDKDRNRTSGGSGLGLSLAKSFTVAHGGKITVTSVFGQGSEFNVYLPLAKQSPVT
jgi:signal transduction histidine kinase